MRNRQFFKKFVKVATVLITGLALLVGFLHDFLGAVYYALNIFG
ncbi:hypothetical protein [Exiguobacterium sp. s22]|nr:hypothetical protein [Exiguobacterium sp. s22]